MYHSDARTRQCLVGDYLSFSVISLRIVDTD